MPHSIWDLSSLTRDWTHVPCSGSTESLFLFFDIFLLMWTIFTIFTEFVTICMLCFFGLNTCRILVPGPGIEPAPLAVEGEVLTGLQGSPWCGVLRAARITNHPGLSRTLLALALGVPCPRKPLSPHLVGWFPPGGPHQGLADFLSGMGRGYIKEPAGQWTSESAGVLDTRRSLRPTLEGLSQ